MPINYEENFNQVHLDLIQPGDTIQGAFDVSLGDFVRIDIGGSLFYSDTIVINSGAGDGYEEVGINGYNDFVIYKDSNDNFYIKPNDILDANDFSRGDYTIRIDFLNKFVEQPFIVREISNSGLEVRLKFDGEIINSQSEIIQDFFNTFGPPGQISTFNYILSDNAGSNHIPIVNYAFDNLTDGENNQSLILKLYEINSFSNLSEVEIYKEVLLTQTINVQYFSNVLPETVGDGLTRDESYDISSLQSFEDQSENYNDLTGSSQNDLTLIDSLRSGSNIDYPNLNIDYSNFENHTFFGSAKKKLKNFKNKLGTIEGYYNQISMSLSGSGVSLQADSSSKIELRQSYFKKIEDEINSFTPYERFLYYDNQSYSSASAPGLGNNYTNDYALNPSGSKYYNYKDGFYGVYQISSSGEKVDVFNSHAVGGQAGNRKDNYRFENPPFYNYSGSLYISFLQKESEARIGTAGYNRLNRDKGSPVYNAGNGDYLTPKNAQHIKNVKNPLRLYENNWLKVVYEVSASYWYPSETINQQAHEFDNATDTSQVYVISASAGMKTGSYSITADGAYQNIATTATGSGIEFKGSILPTGNLAVIFYSESGSWDDMQVTSSFFTDVKITKNDPTDVHPFSYLYTTGSSTFTSWYDGMYESASIWDDENIHSLENNLPTYMREGLEHDDLKRFLNMTGEQYDLIRNHIDNFDKFYSREYKKLDSVPDNLLPILSKNIGWNTITPFSGSNLDHFFKANTNSETDTNTIVNNTWRKLLNNIVYIYKQKGTEASVRSLLNIYGYPPDVFQISEFGGSTQEHNPIIIKDDFSSDVGLNNKEGNISFINKRKKLYHYIVNNNSNRLLKTDWYYNNADVNTIEFVYKHNPVTSNQEILKSSGSASENFWDLRVLTDTNNTSASFQFRLSNSNTGSNTDNDIGKSSVSMSTDYFEMSPGSLWNVLLQRMSSSVSGSGTNEYRLATAYQSKDKIEMISGVSMSISGGLTNTYVTGGADSNYYANQNWLSSGSRHFESASNLFIGREFSGSLSEIKAWTTALTASKWKQHVLNKFSTVGNNITAHKDELIYHYKLNENWTSGSVSGSTEIIKVIDSNPNGPKDNPRVYDIGLPSGSASGSSLYGFDLIDVYTFSLRTGGVNQENSNKIIINPEQSYLSNLNPYRSSIKPLEFKSKKDLVHTEEPKRFNSDKLSIASSPSNYIDDFIINNLADFDLTQLYGKPIDVYSSSYGELDEFRKNFFENYDIKIDNNKFIRGHENLYNQSIIESIKGLIPAKSKLDTGIVIRQNILERQKVKHYEVDIEYGSPGTNGLSSSISIIPQHLNISQSSFESPITSSINMNIPTIDSMSYEHPHSSSIHINIPTIDSMSYEHPYSSSINIDTPTLDSMSYEYPYSSSINMDIPTISTMSFEHPYSSSIELNIPTIGTMSFTDTKDMNIDFRKEVTKEGTTEFDFADKAAETQFTFNKTGSDFGTIKLISKDGTTRQYTSRATSSAYNGETSGSRANAYIRFATSASAGGTITLISYDGTDTTTQKTYKAFATSSAVNGSVFGSFVVFSTGSELGLGGNAEGTASNNLMAAITSSNGHGTKLSVSGSQNDGQLFLTQSNAGAGGNLTITYTSSLDQFGTGSDVYTTYLHSATDTAFAGGSDDDTHIVFGTGSSAINATDNFLAAVTSSHGHVDRFTVSKPTTNSVKLVQVKGDGGNTTITTNTSFNNRTLPNAPFKFGEDSHAHLQFRFFTTASDGSTIKLISNDSDSTTKTYLATGSNIANGAVVGDNVLFRTGSSSSGSSTALMAAITSSNGHENKFTVSQNNGTITIVQKDKGKSGNTQVTTTTDFITSTNPNPNSFFVSGSDNQEGSDLTITIDETETKSIFEEKITLHEPYTSSIDLNIPTLKSMSFAHPYSSSINMDAPTLDSMSFEQPYSASLNENIIPTMESMSLLNTYSASLSLEQVPLMESMSFLSLSHTSSIDVVGLLTSSIVYPVSGTNTQFNEIHTSAFKDVIKDWGTGIDDLHFMSANSGSNDDYNTGHIESRFVFKLVGDIEIQSSSRNDNLKLHHDFSNIHNFKNRDIIDKYQGYTYTSFVNVGGDTTGPQDGRPIGRTAFFSQSADGGTLFYPSNHYVKFANDFSDKQWRGTQNTNPGFFNLQEQEDYSSASFYSVNVTTDNSLRVVRGKNQTDTDGNITKM
tara:strand:- start:2480 stop:9034 length:6555 start_codon:yes stop_codon:yes gene_type:complete